MSTSVMNAIAPESILSFMSQLRLFMFVRVTVLLELEGAIALRRTGRFVRKQNKNCVLSSMKIPRVTES